MATKRNKLGRFIKGNQSPNKGKKLSKNHKVKIALKRFKTIISKEKLEELYFGKKLSTFKIAKLYNVKQLNIIRLMGFYKTKLRSLTESAKIRYKDPKNNPQWIDGRSYDPYPPKFKRLRLKILKRDNHTCQLCGDKFSKKKKLKDKNFITVHHIDYNSKNNLLRNLISLCNFCNVSVNKLREEWTNFFQNKLNKMEV